MSQETKQYAYSENEENYYGRYSTPEAAAADGMREYECDRIIVSEIKPPSPPEEYFDIDDFIEHISCQDDYGSDYADGWCDGATREQKEDINKEVKEVLARWFDKHSLRPTHFICDDPRDYVRGADGTPVPETTLLSLPRVDTP